MEEDRILVIDNDKVFVSYLKDILYKRGYRVDEALSSEKAIEMLKSKRYNLLILKYGMADMETKKLINELKKIDPDSTIIVIFEKEAALKMHDFSKFGIYECLAKPPDVEKMLFLVKKGIELNRLTVSHRRLMQGIEEQNVSLQKQNILLAKRIEESTKNLSRLYDNLRETYMRTIKALAHAIDTRDHYTGSHSANVARYATAIAKEMRLPTKEIEIIREACELHDLGKVGIQDYILSKPTKLTSEEWEQMKSHPLKGAQILEPLTFLGEVIDIVREHHERYDGKGYPFGHKGEQIPLGARIICLADSYDAMTSARSYRKKPLTKDEAVAEVVKNSGKQFDPKVVDAFLRIVDKL